MDKIKRVFYDFVIEWGIGLLLTAAGAAILFRLITYLL